MTPVPADEGGAAAAGRHDLRGRTVLVVGASSGIGRAVAARAIAAGARVAVSGRRLDALEQLVAEAGGGVPLAADVAHEDGCRSLVDRARRALGPLDVLLYCAGVARLSAMADSDAASWEEVLRTNVLGFTHVTRAAVGAMAANGSVLALSSDIVGAPRHTLGAYGVSKAALEQAVRSWRVEEPQLRFTTVVVGGTLPTDFGTAFDPTLLDGALRAWIRHGRMQQRQMDTAEVADVLADVLASAVANPGVSIEELRLRSPSPPAASLDDLVF